MKLIITTLIISLNFVSTNLFSQNQLIFLKDSTLLHVKIINTDDLHVIVQENNEIKRINKNEILDIYNSKSNFYLNKKDLSYFNISDIGMLSGERDDIKKYSLSLHMINGIQIDKRISLGLGFGVEFLDINIIPLFGDLRWNINKGKTQVFIGFQAGFAYPMEKDLSDANWDDYTYSRGSFYNPLIGLKANFNESKNAFVLTFGFRHMKISGERYDDWWADSKYSREFIYDRFSIRVGYYFN